MKTGNMFLCGILSIVEVITLFRTHKIIDFSKIVSKNMHVTFIFIFLKIENSSGFPTKKATITIMSLKYDCSNHIFDNSVLWILS